MNEPSPTQRTGLGLRDLGIAAVLFLVLAGLYRVTLQERLYGNDAQEFSDWFAFPDLHQDAWSSYHNVLYPRAALGLARLVSTEDPLGPLRLVSVLSGALGVACAFLLCRGFGAGRWMSLFACGMLALAPVQWFFSTTIEVHIFHFGVVSLCACITLFAPWRRPALALAVTAAALPFTYLTHQSGLVLGPGWVLLVLYARSRKAEPFGVRGFLVVGAALFAAMVLATMIGNYFILESFRFDNRVGSSTLGAWGGNFKASLFWDLWLRPFWLLLPLAAAGLVLGRLRSLEAAALLALLVCSHAFFFWYGTSEFGGFMVGSSAFLAVLAARIPTPPSGRHALAGILLLTLQGLGGFQSVRRFDSRDSIPERVRIVRALVGERGVLFSANDNAPNMKAYLEGILEINLERIAGVAVQNGVSPEDFAAHALQMILSHARAASVALDLSYQRRTDYTGIAREYMGALETRLRTEMRTTVHEDPSWPMMTIDIR